MPLSAELHITTYPTRHPMIIDSNEIKNMKKQIVHDRQERKEVAIDCEEQVRKLQQELDRLKLKEVEQQQSDFE